VLSPPDPAYPHLSFHTLLLWLFPPPPDGTARTARTTPQAAPAAPATYPSSAREVVRRGAIDARARLAVARLERSIVLSPAIACAPVLAAHGRCCRSLSHTTPPISPSCPPSSSVVRARRLMAQCDLSSSPSAGRTSILRSVVPFSSLSAFYHPLRGTWIALACARTAPAWRRRDAVLHRDPVSVSARHRLRWWRRHGRLAAARVRRFARLPPPRHPLAAGRYRTARPFSVSAIAAGATFAHCSLLVGTTPRVCTARFRLCLPSSSPVETARAARRFPIYLLRMRRSLVFPSPRASLRVIEESASLAARVPIVRGLRGWEAARCEGWRAFGARARSAPGAGTGEVGGYEDERCGGSSPNGGIRVVVAVGTGRQRLAGAERK
jgi:hypothetical protein